MKITYIQSPSIHSDSKNGQNLYQSKISFSARNFTLQQLEQCEKIITEKAIIDSHAGLGFRTITKVLMKQALGEVLNLSGREKEKVESKLSDSIINSVEKLGQDFIKKASELD